jgi:hypothetical protein
MTHQRMNQELRSDDPANSSTGVQPLSAPVNLRPISDTRHGKTTDTSEYHPLQVGSHLSSHVSVPENNINTAANGKRNRTKRIDENHINGSDQKRPVKRDSQSNDEDEEFVSEFVHPNPFDLLASERPKLLQVKEPTKPEISGLQTPRYLYTLYGGGVALSSLSQKDFEALELKFDSSQNCVFERMELGRSVYRSAHFSSVQLAVTALQAVGGRLMCYHCDKPHVSTQCVEGPITKLPIDTLKHLLSTLYYPLHVDANSPNPLLVCKTWRQFLPALVRKIHLSVRPTKRLFDLFSRLKELTVDVNVVNANITTFQSLFSSLTYLEIKSANSCDATSCRSVLYFTSLQCLVLERLDIYASNEFSLQDLTTLQKLTRLELPMVKSSTCQKLVELTSLTGKLEILSLQDCDVQDDPKPFHFLTALTKLRVLDISGTKILRTSIEPFLKNITVIDEKRDTSSQESKAEADGEIRHSSDENSKNDAEFIDEVYFEKAKSNIHLNKLRDAKNLHYGNRQQRLLKDPKYSAKTGRRDRHRKNKK